MTEKQVIEEIIHFSKLSYDRYLVTALGGNISMKFQDKIYITATNVSLHDVTEADIVICDLDGNPLPDQYCTLKPSKEIGMHSLVYKLRPECDSVVHVHPPYLTAFTIKKRPIPMVSGAAMMKLIDVPTIGFAWSGTPELFENIRTAFANAKEGVKNFALEAHGSLSFDKGLRMAFNGAELAEDTAKMAYFAENL